MTLFHDWQNLKKDFENSIVLIQSGIFFQTYDIDAELLSEIFGFTLYEQSGVPVSGFPASVLINRRTQLENLGFKVVVVEETGGEKRKKQRGITYSSDHPNLTEPSSNAKFEIVARSPKIKKGKTEALIEQIENLKSEFGVDVVVAKVGYMFNAFQGDAVKLNEKLGLKMINRFGFPTVGFPVLSKEFYFSRIHDSGFSFASLVDGEVFVERFEYPTEPDGGHPLDAGHSLVRTEIGGSGDLELKNQALKLAKSGFYIFPLAPFSKRPLISNWQKLATTNRLQIESWWNQHPTANIGIACEVSNLIVVDLDVPKDSTPPPDWDIDGIESGEQVFRHVCQNRGVAYPSDTYTVKSPSGGIHLYFHDGGTPVRQGVEVNGWWKVDIRSRGGYIVAASSESMTEDGEVIRYRSLTGIEQLAALPGWLRAELTPTEKLGKKELKSSSGRAIPRTPGHAMGRRFAEEILNERCEKLAGTPEGRRNSELHRHSCYLGILISKGSLVEGDVRSRLLDAALKSGLGNEESLETIDRGIRYGMNIR